MISLKSLLSMFSSLLASSWKDLLSISENDSTDSLKSDWLQANWELLVEGLIGDKVVLESYGEGADCNGSSSRILYPDDIPTHRVICKPLQGNQIYDALNDRQLDSLKDIVFDRFVSIGDDGWYYESPPFDKVLADYDGENVVVSLNEVDFQLQKII